MSKTRRRITAAQGHATTGNRWWPGTINARFDISELGVYRVKNAANSLFSRVWLDDNETLIADRILFMEPGSHWVHYELVDNTEVPDMMFWLSENRIMDIEIPSTVTRLGNSCFRSTSSVRRIVFRGVTPPSDWGLGYYVYGNSHIPAMYTAGDVAAWNAAAVGKGNTTSTIGSMNFVHIGQYTRNM